MNSRSPAPDPEHHVEEFSNLLVFISHSDRDKKLAERLITLIRSSLNLSVQSIRCSSVDGFGLPIGMPVEERLRREIHDAQVFIALLTPESLQSDWVLMELGGRWVTGKRIFPLLAGVEPGELRASPLAVINSLSCNEGQLYQLVEDLGKYLAITPESPAAYRKCILELVQESKEKDVTAKRVLQEGQRSTVSSNPLRGEIGSSREWGSAWIHLDTPRDFLRGERLIVTLGGITKAKQRPAEKVLVRLLRIGEEPNSPIGIITPTGISVPESRIFEVSVPSNYRNVQQISVHGGETAWNYFLGEHNGPAALVSVEVVSAAPKDSQASVGS